MKTEEEKSIVH